jgi:hypothetical protein
MLPATLPGMPEKARVGLLTIAKRLADTAQSLRSTSQMPRAPRSEQDHTPDADDDILIGSDVSPSVNVLAVARGPK